MYIPDGMTEQEVLITIEKVMSVLAPDFKFGYYDYDDIRQEGRIEALKALPRYNPQKKASLYTFLLVHVRNRLNNLRRDKFSRSVLPCTNCRYLKRHKCTEYMNKMECSRYEEWKNLNDSKRSLVEPLEIFHSQGTYDPEFVDTSIKKEILDFIDKCLPIQLRRDYLCWREGSKLPKKRAMKIRDEIIRIIHIYQQINDGEDNGS